MKAPKFEEIAGIILKAADRGEFLSVSEIHGRLSYSCAYGSLRKNLKLFEDREWIAKERAGKSVLIKPTTALYQHFRR